MGHRYWWQLTQQVPTTFALCIRMIRRVAITIWPYRFLSLGWA